jgi:hypothetical protein
MQIVRCPSCDGFGWLEGDDEGDQIACRWCVGAGYAYQDERGVLHVIPQADYAQVADTLEVLERERLREYGYTGEAKKPWEQDIRGENKARMKRGDSEADAHSL